MFAPCRSGVTWSPRGNKVRREYLDSLAFFEDFFLLAPYIWSVSRMASMHVCPCCVGIWRSIDLEQGFPRMRSLWGRVCVFVNQGVCRFMQWSMIVTNNRAGGVGLAGYVASLWPLRI